MKLNGKAIANKIVDIYQNAGETYVPGKVARAIALKELSKKKQTRKANPKATPSKATGEQTPKKKRQPRKAVGQLLSGEHKSTGMIGTGL